MKVILFLSRFTFICNLCFLLFVFFRWQEKKKGAIASSNVINQIPYFKGAIITLGFSAIIINLIMNIICIIRLSMRRKILVPGWILIGNFIFLLIQIVYFFYL